MTKIILEIPNYDKKQGLQTIWEENFEIETTISTNEIVISANKAGLVSLAKQLLTLAQENVPIGSHIHYDEINSLNEKSIDLIVQKI